MTFLLKILLFYSRKSSGVQDNFKFIYPPREMTTLEVLKKKKHSNLISQSYNLPDLGVEPKSASSTVFCFSAFDNDGWRLFGNDYGIKKKIMSCVTHSLQNLFKSAIRVLKIEHSHKIQITLPVRLNSSNH